MEDLNSKHRQELKDLQARINQKKKSATKKTRKGVNDECAELERLLKEQHQSELKKQGENEVADNSLVDSIDAHSKVDSLEIDFADGEPLKSLSLTNGSAPPERVKKPNRQKARLARRAAEQEAAARINNLPDLPDLRAKEQADMQKHYQSRGLKEHEIRSDGHCLYAAIADQLIANGIGLLPKAMIAGVGSDDLETEPAYKATRQIAASFISANPDDFMPFLEQPLKDYVRIIRETGEWGGHLELLALARAYQMNINVLHGNGQVDTMEGNSEDNTTSAWLAYYRHSFGLGEHYNSLRRAN